ncbi:MAG: squalene/phytoene synthase family protein [Roseinatronobacter sp.]
MIGPLAELVAERDPERFAALRAAPERAQGRLLPLYALNIEIARAAWASREPLVAQMRLQFWTDVLDAIDTRAPVPAHEIAGPLAALWQDARLPLALGHQMIAARDWDIHDRRFSADADLVDYLQATGGTLMWLCALALGARPTHEEIVRRVGLASALANWLRAVPALRAAGCVPLPSEKPEAIRALAETGLSALQMARAERARLPAALTPALLAGWLAGPVLRRVLLGPAAVFEGTLEPSEFSRRGSLALRALTGRW